MKILRNALIAFLIGVGSVSCTSITSPNTPSLIVGTGTFVAESGETIRADYLNNDTVVLTFKDGTTKILTRAVSGSGTRYVSGPYEWWEHQGEATYSVNDKPMFTGKLHQ
ncbi:MAG: MliC family protein [Desulfobacteraceae bacterium]|nr:MliC family protein [Desulfobacteraceae bacterium]